MSFLFSLAGSLLLPYLQFLMEEKINERVCLCMIGQAVLKGKQDLDRVGFHDLRNIISILWWRGKIVPYTLTSDKDRQTHCPRSSGG
jgi:hypothetical protein